MVGGLLLDLGLVVLAGVLVAASFYFGRRKWDALVYAVMGGVTAIWTVVGLREDFGVVHVVVGIVMSLALAGLAVGTYQQDHQ